MCACLHHWRLTPYPGEPEAYLVSRIIAGEVKPAEAIPEGAPLSELVQRCCSMVKVPICGEAWLATTASSADTFCISAALHAQEEPSGR